MSIETAVTNTLDLCGLAPLKRQQVVFGYFESLQPGQWFQVTTDHDPKALHEQLKSRSGGSLTWDVLEAGPTAWRVQLGKLVQESGGCCSGGACHG